MHGAKSVSGAGSASFKHGRFSKVLPGRMIERYGATLSDPAFTELKDEIGLTDAMLEDLVKRLDSGESAAAWTELASVWRRFQEAQPAKDTTTAGRCLRRMGEIIEEGLDETSARKEIRLTVNQRRQLAESERRRAVENHQMISSEEMLALVAALVDIVRRHVSDRKVLGAISSEIGTLISAGAPGDAGGDPRLN